MKFNKIVYILILTSIIISFTSIILLVSHSNNKLTAHAVTEIGYIKMKVLHIVAIEVPPDESIVFGKCKINKTQQHILLDSAGSILDFNNINCKEGIFPDYMDIKNSGNLNARIEISPLKSSEDFFQDNASWYAYAFQNSSTSSGCEGFLQSNYLNFTNSSESYLACSNLKPNNKIRMTIRAYVTTNAKGGGSSDIRFIAFAT